MSHNAGQASDGKRAPEKVMSATRVNVAFPFSSVRIHEPSEHLIALTVLVRDMAVLLGDLAPGPEVERLSERAEELLAKVR
ncbi:hypothetical protein ACVBEQ_24220 [Nakamurella sp. GG22]